MTDLTAQRDADRRYTFTPSSGFTFAELTPLFKVWLGEGNADTPALTVSLTPTVNGSSFVAFSTSQVLTLDKADLAALPDGDLYYDITLTDGTGFENALCGGVFNLFPDGSEGDCGGCGGVINFSAAGQCVTVMLQGGNLAIGASISLAELNAAVALADAAAASAAASAAAAAASVAGIPTLIAGKLNRNADNADASILTNLPYLDSGTGAVAIPLYDYIDEQPIDASTYGFVPGVVDKSAELQKAVDAALASGRELYIPPGNYRVDTGIKVYLNTVLTYTSSSTFRAGFRVRGAGSGRVVIDSRAASDWLFYVTVGNGSGGEYDFALPKFGLGGYIQGMTIRNGAATTASGGIRLRAQYQFAIRDVHVTDLSGTGIKLRCSLGDIDGNNQVLIEDVRVENTGGWGVDLGTDAGHNENSFSTCNRVFVQNCGTAEQKAITNITQANPAVVTSTAHGFTNGTQIFIGGVTGMTQVNSYNFEAPVTVTVINANSYSINVNTTGFGAYVAGGNAFPRTPASGGTRVKGQITTFQSCGWTVNKNRSVWIDGEGTLPSDVFFYDSTIENPQLIGLHVQGNRVLVANGLHVYFNAVQANGPEYWGHLYDGVSNVVSDIKITGAVIRSTNAAGENDVVCFQGIGANYYRDTVRIDPQTLLVKQFGYGNQVMFKNIAFDPIPQQCILAVSSATEVRLRPDTSYPNGAFMPIRVSYGGSGGAQFSSGAWIPTLIPSAGVTISNSGLAADTTYYPYLYSQNTTLNAPAIELSTTAPTLAADGSGYPVKTGDQTRLSIVNPDGTPVRVRTDGSSQFVTTNSSYLAPLRLGGESVGARASMWYSSADRKIRIKTGSTLPSVVADANYEYWADVEYFISPNVVVTVPAGAAGVFTTSITAAGFAVGDYVLDVQTPVGLGTFAARGTCNVAGTINVIFWDPAQVGGSLNGGTAVRVQVAARRR